MSPMLYFVDYSLRFNAPDLRTLYLHIGLPKTGTSYLQACFYHSREKLQSLGLDYPFAQVDTYTMANGRQGVFIKGNGHVPLQDLSILATHLGMLEGQGGDVFFSSELFLEYPLHSNGGRDFVETARHHGFTQICILLFVREPLALFRSMNLQRSKAHDAVYFQPQEYSNRFIGYMNQALRYLEALEAFPEVSMTIRNFSRLRDRIVAVTESWLGIPEGTLARPSLDTLNRSLTADEDVLSDAIKRNMTRPYPVFGALAEQLPQLSTPMRWPSVEEQRYQHEGLRELLEAFTRRLPPDEPLVFEFREPSPPMTDVIFSGAQCEVFGPELSLTWDAVASGEGGIEALCRWMDAGAGFEPGITVTERLFRQLVPSDRITGSIDFFGIRPVTGRMLKGPAKQHIIGWVALDAEAGHSAEIVFLLIEEADGRCRLAPCDLMRRHDVVTAFGREGLEWCGFNSRNQVGWNGVGRLRLLVSHAGVWYHNENLTWDLA